MMRLATAFVLAVSACSLAADAEEPLTGEEQRPVVKSEPKTAGFSFVEKADRLEVQLNGRPFGTYLFRHEKLTRPAWIDVHTPGGMRVTRNFPPRLPEDQGAMDHELMHPGIWISFGHLNGQDYWRLKARTEHLGFVEKPQAKAGSASFAVRNRYHTEDGKGVVCHELARYSLSVEPNGVLMRTDTEFKSEEADFYFGDQEESGLAFRVASRLRVDGGGGEILNDRGERNGRATWGKEAKWISYLGAINGRRVGIKVTPSPHNARPCWMHSRDYGVVACNPFPKQPAERRQPYVKTWVKKGQPYKLSYDVLIHDVAE